MRFLQDSNRFLGVALAACAILQTQGVGAVVLQNFLLSNFTGTTRFQNSMPSVNISLSFLFSDPNSGTSTTCGYSWLQGEQSEDSYITCKPNGNNEAFGWKFTSFTFLDEFQVELTHTFSDPTDYPPPYDMVTYFSAPTNITLDCRAVAPFGLTLCTLDPSLSPVHSVVDAIAD